MFSFKSFIKPIAIMMMVMMTMLGRAWQSDDQPIFPTNPDQARLITEDISRFWQVMEEATPEERAQRLQNEYIQQGSQGVKNFVRYRIVSGKALARTIEKYPTRYGTEAKARTLRVKEMEPEIRRTLRKAKDLYPDSIFPDVFFVIGRLNTGGTLTRNGLIIGTEMYAESDEKLKEIPYIVAHEWVHFQQNPAPQKTLLDKAIQEGAADFISELIAGNHINRHVHAFADSRQEEIWKLFEKQMHSPFDSGSGWMYGGSVIENGPNDLGYYVGYKICEAYYQRAKNKKQAVREILLVESTSDFLKASGYGFSEKK